MHFKLVCPSNASVVLERPENAAYDRNRVIEKLDGHHAHGDSYEVTDTTAMSDADRSGIYLSEAIAAAGNRYRIARVFGSNEHPGEDFGRGTPALLAYKQMGDRPVDVFPHEFKDGRLVTIADCLAEL